MKPAHDRNCNDTWITFLYSLRKSSSAINILCRYGVCAAGTPQFINIVNIVAIITPIRLRKAEKKLSCDRLHVVAATRTLSIRSVHMSRNINNNNIRSTTKLFVGHFLQRSIKASHACRPITCTKYYLLAPHTDLSQCQGKGALVPRTLYGLFMR